jgi:hypothetical protein
VAAAAALLAVGGAALAGCAVPPWSMGRPLDGTPSIPPTTGAPSIAALHVRAHAERAARRPALELRALLAIAGAERLQAEERTRLVLLLEERATELLALGRAVPACDDLRALEDLAPARARALAALHGQAERDAGDVWLAVGDRRRARAAYEIAAALGVGAIDIRLAAVSDPAPARLARATIERGVLELPLRAVPAFAEVYVGFEASGQSRAALERARRAAHQENRRALLARIDARLAAGAAAAPGVASPANVSRAAATDDGPGEGEARASGTRDAGVPPTPDGQQIDQLLDAPAVPAASRPPVEDRRLGDWAVGAASVSFRLLPVLGARADLLAPGERSRAWSDLLLDEDPTAPEVLALTAVIDGLAGRTGGTERKLTDLVYFTPDRYQGLVRAAAIWERVGQARRACASWLRAARWRDEPEDPAWRRAIACTRRDPDAGDFRAITAYVLQRAPAERRAALAVELDPLAAAPPPASATTARAAAPVSDRRAGDPIPCDTGGSPR